jgi:hypothetical protein
MSRLGPPLDDDHHHDDDEHEHADSHRGLKTRAAACRCLVDAPESRNVPKKTVIVQRMFFLSTPVAPY